MLRNKPIVILLTLALIFLSIKAHSQMAQEQPIGKSITKEPPQQDLANQKNPSSQFIAPQQILDTTTSKINTNIEKYKTIQDATQPGNSAWLFSFFLVIFTGGLVIVGGVQCFIIFRTLKETQIAAKAAYDSTNIIPAIERAYLFVKIRLDISNNDPDEIIKIGTPEKPAWNTTEIIVTNHGKTPAILMNVGLLTNFIDDMHGGKIINSVFGVAQNSLDVNILPGTEIIDSGNDRIFKSYFTANNTQWQEMNKSQRLVCWGFIKYKDVFGISHETAFCWQWQELWEGFYPDKKDQERNYQT
jgi:hypothetical protein